MVTVKLENLVKNNIHKSLGHASFKWRCNYCDCLNSSDDVEYLVGHGGWIKIKYIQFTNYTVPVLLCDNCKNQNIYFCSSCEMDVLKAADYSHRNDWCALCE